MGRKIRRLIGIAVLACTAMSLGALSADDIVRSAIENSSTIRTLNINRENSLLNRQISDVGPSTSVTLSTGAVTVSKSEFSGKPVFSMGPSVTVTIPEGDDATLSLALTNETSYDFESADTSVRFTPDATYSRTINLNSYKDSRDDLKKVSGELSQDVSYEKSLIQFEIGVLQSIVTIMQSELGIKTSQISYDRQVIDRQTALISGDITPDSLKDLQSQMNLETRRVALESSKARHEELLKTFRDNYGIDYQTPDSVREAKLEVDVLEKGNSTVLLAEISLELARQTLDAMVGTTTKLDLGANTNIPMTTTGRTQTVVVNGSVSGTITGANYSVGTRAGASYKSEELYPYITITGTWTNKKTANTDAMTIQTLQNNVILAQMDYDSAVASYRNDVESLRSSISDHQSDVAQFEVSASYNRMILERTQEMYDKGLVTERDLEDARMNVEKDEAQALIYRLNALVLEDRIAALQL
jgi:hypothetical protein